MTAWNEEDVIVVKASDKCSFTVHLYGATLISWMIDGKELIFVSEKSLFDNKKAIRGGIPLVFPNFGPWEAGPQHGFARINRWTVADKPCKDDDGNYRVSLTLESNDAIRSMWNYPFRLKYTIILSEKERRIKTELSIENTGDKEFPCTFLLHTYFKTIDISSVGISGLKGASFLDKVAGVSGAETRDIVTIGENIDRVYENVPNENIIKTSTYQLKLVKKNLPDTVVWNPWSEKAKAMSDFGDEEYRFMFCVEAGHVSKPFIVEPGTTHKAEQSISVLDLSN